MDSSVLRERGELETRSQGYETMFTLVCILLYSPYNPPIKHLLDVNMRTMLLLVARLMNGENSDYLQT